MALTREEYLEIILDHHDNPHSNHPLPDAQIHGSGGNPGCGDLVTMYARLGPDGRVAEAAFEGEGCTISQAGASMLTEMIEGKTLDEIRAMDYEAMVEAMGREIVLPRVRCATLALSILKSSVNDYRPNGANGSTATT
ncbi:MAG: SUF system NifU family Fe-S cluster assembly protein [Chloroflexota bacterium]